MDSEATRGILRDIHTLYTIGTTGGRTDAELLERFLARGDSDAEHAFATLVARHGPMVLRVCRRMLPASHDAEDAFQGAQDDVPGTTVSGPGGHDDGRRGNGDGGRARLDPDGRGIPESRFD